MAERWLMTTTQLPAMAIALYLLNIINRLLLCSYCNYGYEKLHRQGSSIITHPEDGETKKICVVHF